MSDSAIHIVARLIARPAAMAEVRDVLETLLATTRQEAGCRRSFLLQNQQEPTDFTFVEEWADEAAIDSHMKSPHFQAAFARAENLLAAKPAIQRYGLIG